MKLALSYAGPEGEPFFVPQDRLLAVAEPRDGEQHDDQGLFRHALREPLHAPRLREAAEGAERVLLIVDDHTRHTPVADALPHVAREVEAAGVDDDAVTVLTAQGTHRPMTADELGRKLGAFRDRWRVEQHDHRREEHLVHVGDTPAGMPVVVNRLVPESDLVVGIGSVTVHGIMGMSGGAKIMVPGVAGDASERWTHWSATKVPQAERMGALETPQRRAIEEAADVAGLDAVLNVVTDRHGRLQHVAYGDPVAAQRDCAIVARHLNAARLPRQADVVVSEAHPADRDYWQSVKGLYAADLAVADGGTIILVAPNPEGVAVNHPDVLDLAGRPEHEIRDLMETGALGDAIGAAVATFTAQVRARADVILVSGGVTEDEARRLGFRKARTVHEAIHHVLAHVDATAKVAVLRHAGTLLPVVPGVNAHLLPHEPFSPLPRR